MSLTITPQQIVEESSSPLLAAPEGWTRRPLGEVATVLNGYAFKSAQFVREGGVPLIRIRDIFKTETAVQYAGEYDDRYVVNPGELLVGMDGNFNVSRWAGPPALLNQRVCKVTPEAADLDIEYLFYVLPGYLRAIHDATSSLTVAHLSSRDVAQIPLPVPSLFEQRALVEKVRPVAEIQERCRERLDGVRTLIARFRRTVVSAACAGRLTQEWRNDAKDLSSVEDALGQASGSSRKSKSRPAPVDLPLPELPESYLVAALGQAATILEYGTSKKCGDDSRGVPVLRMGNITDDGLLRVDDLKYAPKDAGLKRLSLEDGDLLFNRTNSAEKVGKSAVFHEAREMSFASYVIRVRFDPNIADPDFVNLWLNSAWGRLWARHVKTDGVSQSNINGTKLGNMPLPLPPIEEQREIVERAGALLKVADELADRLGRAQTTIEQSAQAVLAKAFRGEPSPAVNDS